MLIFFTFFIQPLRTSKFYCTLHPIWVHQTNSRKKATVGYEDMKDEIVPYNQKEEGVVIYRTEDNTLQLDVQVADETVWLTQDQIAILFGTQRPAITKHLNNIYNSGELDFESTCPILERMGNDGKQRYQTKYYNLEFYR